MWCGDDDEQRTLKRPHRPPSCLQAQSFARSKASDASRKRRTRLSFVACYRRHNGASCCRSLKPKCPHALSRPKRGELAGKTGSGVHLINSARCRCPRHKFRGTHMHYKGPALLRRSRPPPRAITLPLACKPLQDPGLQKPCSTQSLPVSRYREAEEEERKGNALAPEARSRGLLPRCLPRYRRHCRCSPAGPRRLQGAGKPTEPLSYADGVTSSLMSFLCSQFATGLY